MVGGGVAWLCAPVGEKQGQDTCPWPKGRACTVEQVEPLVVCACKNYRGPRCSDNRKVKAWLTGEGQGDQRVGESSDRLDVSPRVYLPVAAMTKEFSCVWG